MDGTRHVVVFQSQKSEDDLGMVAVVCIGICLKMLHVLVVVESGFADFEATQAGPICGQQQWRSAGGAGVLGTTWKHDREGIEGRGQRS